MAGRYYSSHRLGLAHSWGRHFGAVIIEYADCEGSLMAGYLPEQQKRMAFR